MALDADVIHMNEPQWEGNFQGFYIPGWAAESILTEALKKLEHDSNFGCLSTLDKCHPTDWLLKENPKGVLVLRSCQKE